MKGEDKMEDSAALIRSEDERETEELRLEKTRESKDPSVSPSFKPTTANPQVTYQNKSRYDSIGI